MAAIMPTRVLRNASVDSRRWDNFHFRPDDIVIDTYGKSGTTWTQQILGQLITNGNAEAFGQMMSPWVDCFFMPDALAFTESITHRRFLKSHLPADALPIDDSVRYLFVARDTRDMFWSWHNHHSSYTDAFLTYAASLPDRVGPPVARQTLGVQEAYLEFIEKDNIPIGPYWHHIRSWWNIRHLPNVLLLHYNDLKQDLEGVIRRIADFVGIKLDEARLPDMVRHCGIDHMRELARKVEALAQNFEGGADSFFHKGTNGRWRDVLSPKEIALADKVAARELTDECSHWLRTGEMLSA